MQKWDTQGRCHVVICPLRLLNIFWEPLCGQTIRMTFFYIDNRLAVFLCLPTPHLKSFSPFQPQGSGIATGWRFKSYTRLFKPVWYKDWIWIWLHMQDEAHRRLTSLGMTHHAAQTQLQQLITSKENITILLFSTTEGQKLPPCTVLFLPDQRAVPM